MTDTYDLTGPHWEFSLAVYGETGVESSCLHMQDLYGVDINILLLSLYAAVRLQSAPDDNGIMHLDASIREIRHNLVEPLRLARRFLKPKQFGDAGERIRAQVKKIEIQAEQLEQAMIAAAINRLPFNTVDVQALAERIVQHYAKQYDGSVSEMDEKAVRELKVIVSAALKHAAETNMSSSHEYQRSFIAR